jgi:methyl-accepting chemotaxis protein I, serine sensor receptor
MDRITQQNAALVEQAAAASSALHDQSRLLKEAVSVFEISDAVALHFS